MRPSSVCLAALACLLGFSSFRCSSPLGPGPGHSVSIVAYNVKSLFDAVDDGPEFSEFSVARGRWDEARYKIRLANVAAAVFAAVPSPGPDILCLEEIENGKVLEVLRAGPLSAARYRYAAIAPAEGGPFSNCVLSRLPIAAVSCHSAATPAGRAGRDVLEVDLELSGHRLVLLSCHWKSKSEGGEATEEARRETAALVRGLVAARMAADASVDLVVCGDFNESPDEYRRVERRYATALMPLEDAEPALGAAPARLLVASSATAMSAAAAAAARGGEISLYSPWEDSGGYSYSFRGSRERLDGFLLSPGLLDSSGLAYKRFTVASAPFLVDEKGAPLAWPGSGATGYSDHLPIALLLEAAAAER